MLVQLLVITVVAHLAGAAARRLRQPAVIGQLVAGVLLGPSVLGVLWPDGEHRLVPGETLLGAPINTVAWLGAAFLLLLTGLDTDLGVIRRLGRPALMIAAGAVLVPFAAGVGLALLLPDSFAGGAASRPSFVLLVAVSLSISSIPVVARVLTELGFLKADFGQMILTVALVSDAVGWMALAGVTVLAGPGGGDAGELLAPVAGLLLLTAVLVLVAPRLVDAALARVRRSDRLPGGTGGTGGEGEAGEAGTGGSGDLLVAVVLALVLAVAADAVGSDGLLGAFAAGLLLGRSPHYRPRLRGQLEPVTLVLLAPVFFAVAGLRMDLTVLSSAEALLWAAGYLAVAVCFKVAGAYGGARLARLPRRQGLAVAVGLNCRGAVEVVVASVGLSAGVLSETGYTVIVLMALLTTAATGPLLRAVAPPPGRLLKPAGPRAGAADRVRAAR
ncbi:cation:proton antiporter [Streptomyces sp. BE303]|uniref:cation:proton antiporter n=1 Tax=Streptomyces sp. BE303 TaxID=3002528 RepID=UPI002E7601B9|nr:cation:proton antiporter [Streptomyces sp. BE303]